MPQTNVHFIIVSTSVADPWHCGVVRIRTWIHGFMPLTNGSGSCYFRHRPARCQQKNSFFILFFLLITFWRYQHLHLFTKIKSQKESQSSRNQGFSYYFCIMIEGSRSWSGSIPLINGSGSGSRRPKNIRIWWIRIRIRIRNTGINRAIWP